MAYPQVLEALAEPRRRQILQALKSAPLSVGEIAETQPVSRPAISQHLKVLMQANLVDVEERGTQRIYHIKRQGFEELQRWVNSYWDDALVTMAEL